MKAKFLALAALVLGLASCQTDPEVVNPTVDAEVDFQLSVAAPELATRAGKEGAADDQKAMNSAYGAIDYLQGAPAGDYRQDWGDVDLRYTLEVYDKADNYAGATPVKDRQVIIVDKYQPVVFDLRLVPNREYHFVVFADFVDEGSASKTPAEQLLVNGIRHEIGATLADITVKNEAINDEVADSYFATKDINIANSAAQDIVLRRPYGKVRVIATDLAELNLNVNPYTVEMEYEACNPNKFNAVTGKLNEGTYAVKSFKSGYVAKVRENMGDHFYNADYDAKTATAVNGTVRNTHITLFTDYILALPEGQTPIHFNMVVKDEAGVVIKETAFTTDIPVERNKLTTVIGNVLTTATEIEVRIDDNFAGEYIQASWDGKATEPKKDAEGNWIIAEASELAWLAAAVNGTLENTRTAVPAKTFKGETFKLTKDIDLNNDRWTPIGATGKFEGTFDGQGHKITNLFVSESDKTPVGLFANAYMVKNVKVIGAEIYGHYKAGVIVGNGLCSRIDNCHVEDAIVKVTPLAKDDANHAGGIVGYLSAEGTAYVTNCSVKNAEIIAFRDVAAIAGTANNSANGTVVVSGNTVENVTVTADQTVEYVSNDKDGNAAAVAGRLGSNANITNNTVADVVVIRKVDSTKEMEYAVADAQSGDTIYVGNGEVALPHFENKALYFVGIHDNAAIAEPVSRHENAFWQGAELNFSNLKIKGTTYTGNANGYVKSAKETYTHCKFVDGYYMFAGDVVTVDNCVFTGKYNSYFWTGSADKITFNKCVFNGVERIVKVCTVGHTGVEREVNFTECTFTATEQKKTAIEIDGTKGSSYIVNINECTESGFAKGEFTDIAMFNVEGAENVEVYLDGIKWIRNGVMEDENGMFAYNANGLQYLLDNAVNGETVKIGADIEGDVTINQKADVKIAIEGSDHKFAGVITVDGKSATYTTAGVTIKNLNFEADAISADACIRLGDGTNATRYACNVAVEGCTFNVPGVVAVKSYTGGDKNLSIKGCTGTGLHSLAQLKNVEGVTIEGVEVTAGRGASFGASSNIVVKNSTFVAESYGLRVDGSVESTLSIEGGKIEAYIPVSVRKMSDDGYNVKVILDGTEVVKGGLYDVAICSNEYEEGVDAVAPKGTYKVLSTGTTYSVFPTGESTLKTVAKVGSVEYVTIDEAIAKWGNNATLTLLDNVTLSDVITIKSTEHHILDLGTYTMTAASGKNAIEITPEGAGTAARSCLTINADATNPGGINAGSKACIYYKKTNGINDRLMVTINGGIYDGNISSSSNNGGQACPYFVINGGVFNKSVNLTKAMLKVTGGIFHGMFSCTGDSTAYRLISGGTFKSWTFMTADAATKFCIGTAKGVYDVGVYVNDDNYLVVGGPVITDFGTEFEAKATNATKWSSYLQYSSAAANGLYYTNAEMAIKKHGEANVVLK